MKLNSDQVLKDVRTIFKEVLDDEDLAIERQTTANDVDDWDSLTHLQLVVAIEKHFKVRFKGEEVQGYANVGEMCDAIVAKLNAN
jgi:acyl carrier protein